jgi:hypothetical protein
VVFDGRGQTVANATVVLVDNQNDPPVLWDKPEAHPLATVTHTDSRGRFSFTRMKPGIYWLYARSNQGEAHVRRIGFHDEAPERYELHLTSARIEGVLLWPGGRKPIPDGVIRIDKKLDDDRNSGEFTTNTDSLGRFSYFGLGGGDFSLWAKAAVSVSDETKEVVARYGAARNRKGDEDSIVDMMREASVRMEFHAEEGAQTQVSAIIPDGSIAGVVLTSDKKPVEGVLVGRAVTDSAGRFFLPYLPAGTHWLQAHGKGGELRNLKATVQQDQRTDLGVITLYPFRPKIVFHFEAPDGASVPNTGVMYLADSERSKAQGACKTDDSGRYVYHLMDSGEVRCFFVVPGHGYWPFTTVAVKEGVREVRQTVRVLPASVHSDKKSACRRE